MPVKLNPSNLLLVMGLGGAGKSTLVRTLAERHRDVGFLISHTTRKRRVSDDQDRSYYFIDKTDVASLDWIEHVMTTDGRFYGLAAHTLAHTLDESSTVLFDCDEHGRNIILERWPFVWTIWLDVSRPIRERRMRKRGDHIHEVAQRLARDTDDRQGPPPRTTLGGEVFTLDASASVDRIAANAHDIIRAMQLRVLT